MMRVVYKEREKYLAAEADKRGEKPTGKQKAKKGGGKKKSKK